MSHGDTAPDDTEVLQLQRVPLDDAVNMALEGSITDSLSLAALLKVGILLDRGVLKI